MLGSDGLRARTALEIIELINANRGPMVLLFAEDMLEPDYTDRLWYAVDDFKGWLKNEAQQMLFKHQDKEIKATDAQLSHWKNLIVWGDSMDEKEDACIVGKGEKV